MPKSLVWTLLGGPALWLCWRVYAELRMPGTVFSADPALDVVHYFGGWAIYLVIAALAIGSISRMFRSRGGRILQGIARDLRRHRRAVGVAAFLYATLHLLAYVVLLNAASLTAVLDDFSERPYILAGLVAVTLLLPLAVTSTNGWVRRLGGTRWGLLHRLVYVAAIAAWIHVLWLAKSSYFDAALFGVVIGLLLAERILDSRLAASARVRRSQSSEQPAVAQPGLDSQGTPTRC